MPAGSTVVALALDPADPTTPYAGTEHCGLFRSVDGGAHWQPWGLDGSSVYAILPRRLGSIWLATDRGVFCR